MIRSSKYILILVIVLDFLCTSSESAKGYGPGEQDWGFLDVREGAHMFYWLYYTNANVSSYTERPLVVWMVGGPGSSSAAYGNFEEVGPLTLEGEDRSFSWDKYTNLLLVDSPVGAGYSYVDDESLLTTTNKQIALDFVSFMKAFYAKHPEFESIPLHLFGESYAGKMIIEISLELHRAIERGELRSNFKSVTMMTPIIAAVECVMNKAPYLLSVGVLDKDGYDVTIAEAKKYADLIANKNYTAAKLQTSNVSLTAYTAARGINSLNILRNLPVASPGDSLPKFNAPRVAILEKLLIAEVGPALKVNVTWGPEELVKTYLNADLEVPIVDIIIEVLESTDLKVGIVSGQLDLVANSLGLGEFMKKLNWSYKADYDAAPREGFSVNGILEGYKKSAGKFTFFWINRAGHLIPQDNPAALTYVLKYFTNYDDSTFFPGFL